MHLVQQYTSCFLIPVCFQLGLGTIFAQLHLMLVPHFRDSSINAGSLDQLLSLNTVQLMTGPKHT